MTAYDKKVSYAWPGGGARGQSFEEAEEEEDERRSREVPESAPGELMNYS